MAPVKMKYNSTLCNLCGLCIGICPTDAIESHGNRLNIDDGRCIECDKCLIGCPSGALSLTYQKPSKDYGDFDIAIIGGGPAGMTACYHAAKKGLKTILIEKKQALDFPLSCAEGISIEGFETSGISIMDDWYDSIIEGGCLVSPNGKKTILHHPNAGYMLDRRKMLKGIASEATKMGAKILVGAELTDIDEESGRIEIDNSSKAKAKYIIAADGVEGAVKRILNIHKKRFTIENIHTAAQYVVAGIDIQPNYPVFYLGKKIAPAGYLWIFPKKNSIANIGLGILPQKGKTARDYLDRFLEDHFKHYSILEYTGGMVPANPIGTLRYRNILFIGDAANLTDPLSGGGIAHAFESAKIAAETIAKAIESDNIKILDKYQSSIKKQMGRKLRFYRRLRILFERLDDSDLEEVCDFVHQNLHGKTKESLDIIGTFINLIKSHARLLRLMMK
ncbi:MAG: geranylgeranyl reductase family protein [Candidatus Zixiibacteriota bacterium]